ncbi:MAG: hypothetical protein KDD89_09260 [Anaerolineales bacterium]|nr:hypothetical protein [Anaerolineales bacterium]
MMKLLLLRCPTCAEPLPAENDDVVLTCPSCFSDVQLDERGVNATAVSFAQPTYPDKLTHWLPFWVMQAKVNITKRDTQGGSKSVRKDSEAMWAEPRLLYTPAWDLPVPQARQMGSDLVLLQPTLSALATRPSDALLTPAVFTTEDAQRFLTFVVLTIEAERKDWLKDLQFQITPLKKAELWALPAVQTGDHSYSLLIDG